MEMNEALSDHSYQQLAGWLRSQILAGQITTQLPSLTELTASTGLAVGTVRRAIRVLVLRGDSWIVPGRGTFVAVPADR